MTEPEMMPEEVATRVYELIDEVRKHSKNGLPAFTDQQIWWAFGEAGLTSWEAAQSVLLDCVINGEWIGTVDYLPARPKKKKSKSKSTTTYPKTKNKNTLRKRRARRN